MRGTTEQGDFVARFQSLSTNLPASLADLETDAKNHLAEVNSLLGRTDFKTIDAAFEQWRKTSRKKYDPEWYKVLGKRSLRQITGYCWSTPRRRRAHLPGMPLGFKYDRNNFCSIK